MSYHYILLYYIISIYLYSSYILFTLLRKVVSYISLTREPYVSSRFSVSLRVVIFSSISVLYLLWYNIWSLLVTDNYWIVLLVFSSSSENYLSFWFPLDLILYQIRTLIMSHYMIHVVHHKISAYPTICHMSHDKHQYSL
jgi:hypothetical protein